MILEVMPLKHDTLLKVHRYAAEARTLQEAHVGESDNTNTKKVIGTDERLQKTLELMQKRIQQQRADLEKVRI